jgi:hypothetical protein
VKGCKAFLTIGLRFPMAKDPKNNAQTDTDIKHLETLWQYLLCDGLAEELPYLKALKHRWYHTFRESKTMKRYHDTAMDIKQDTALLKGKSPAIKKAFMKEDIKKDKPGMSAKADVKKDKAILKKIEKKMSKGKK